MMPHPLLSLRSWGRAFCQAFFGLLGGILLAYGILVLWNLFIN